jgi:hypothetical protein
MVALVLAVECFIASRWLDFSDPVSLNWRLAAQEAVSAAPGCDVLLLGDSLVKHGLVPKVIEERSGHRVHNLGIARGPAPLTYFVFRRALDAGATPSAVVVDFKPGVLAGDVLYNLRNWQEIATPRECLDLALADGGGSFLTPLVLGRLLFSVRGRLEIRANLQAALRGEHAPFYLMNRVLLRNWSINRGASVAAANPAFHGELTPEHEAALAQRVWYCHKLNAQYIDRIFELAAARGIKVFWLLPPLAPRLQERREHSANEAGYLALVRSVMRRFPNVTILDGRHAAYAPSLFIDPTHLNGRGASALSLDVANVLRRDRAQPALQSRWLDLPRYRKRPFETPLEDVEQTKLALSKTLLGR